MDKGFRGEKGKEGGVNTTESDIISFGHSMFPWAAAPVLDLTQSVPNSKKHEQCDPKKSAKGEGTNASSDLSSIRTARTMINGASQRYLSMY